MTTYSTGNTVGSTEVKDLYDNAENLDYLVVGTADSYPDRLGVSRKSWKGMENSFDAFLLSKGWEYLGDYDIDGPFTLTDRNQIFQRGDYLYRIQGGVAIPYTTSATFDWGVDGPNFVALDDNSLRDELSNTTDPSLGTAIAGRASVAISNIPNLLLQEQRGDIRFIVSSYHPSLFGGGGNFFWSASTPKTGHNGVTIFDPDREYPVDWSDQAQRVAWYAPSVSGSGCFVRDMRTSYLRMTQAGGKGDRTTDDSESFLAAYDVSRNIHFDGGQFLLTKRGADINGFILQSFTKIRCTGGGSIVRGKIGSGDGTDLWCVLSAFDEEDVDISGITIDFDASQGRGINLRRCLDVKVNNNKFFDNYTTGRTVIGDSVQIVVIMSCQIWEFKNNWLYSGPRGYGPATLDYTSFGLRVTTPFIYGEDTPTEFCSNGIVSGNHFIGPFLWNSLEVAGKGTRDIMVYGNQFVDPILTTIDIDKGCKRITFDNNTVLRPRQGIWAAPGSGGDGFIGINVQGYWGDGHTPEYAEDITITNNTIYDNGVTDALAVSGSTFCNINYAKRVAVHNNRSYNSLWRSGLTTRSVEDITFSENKTRAYDFFGLNSDYVNRLTVKDCEIETIRYGMVANASYLTTSIAKVKFQRNNFRFVGVSNVGVHAFIIDNATGGGYIIEGNTGEGYSRCLSMNATGAVSGYLKDNISLNCGTTNVYAGMANSGNVEATY